MPYVFAELGQQSSLVGSRPVDSTVSKILEGKLRRLHLAASWDGQPPPRRRGACNRCGACCRLIIRCPYLIDEPGGVTRCDVYERRPATCKGFPFDERDLEDVRVSCGGCECSVRFEPAPISDLAGATPDPAPGEVGGPRLNRIYVVYGIVGLIFGLLIDRPVRQAALAAVSWEVFERATKATAPGLLPWPRQDTLWESAGEASIGTLGFAIGRALRGRRVSTMISSQAKLLTSRSGR